MSDDQNDQSEETAGKGIFDLFEPPPEIDPNRFGPIPVVSDDREPPAEEDSTVIDVSDTATGESTAVGDASISSIFGFDPIDPVESTPNADTAVPAVLIDDLADAPSGAVDDVSVISLDEVSDLAAEADQSSPTNLFAIGTDTASDDTASDDTASDDTATHEAVASSADDDEVAAALADLPEADASAVDTAAGSDGALPHWTAPATGMVPKVIAGDDGAEGWSTVSGPRWHGEGPQWAGDDLEAVFADEEGVGGPRRVTIDDGDMPDIPGAAGSPQRPEDVAARAAQRPVVEVDGGRNLGQAIGVGVAFAAVAAAAFWLGNATTIALVAVVAVLASIELFGAMRQAGLHPATLLGIVASAALPLAAYQRGDAGFTLVIALSVLASALWYLSGADSQRPAVNIGLTMLGITWIGGLAAFAAFILQSAGGVEVILAVVIITVASDTGAYIGGKAIGSTPFHQYSPNKTWEGTIVGIIASVAAGFLVALAELSVFSGNLTDGVLLGLVIGVMAPIGDLTESMVKRDLGVKDMGNLLPGHGGFLDRVDGLLFALPAAFYLGNVLGLL